MKHAISILLFCFSLVAHSQIDLDSLYGIWQDQNQTDSLRVDSYNKYIWDGYLFSKPDTAFIMAETMHSFAEENNYLPAHAKAYNIQGVMWGFKGHDSRALSYYKQALKINEQLDNKLGWAQNLGNIGNIYKNLGDYTNALDCVNRSYEIFEKLGDERGIISSLYNLGGLHGKLGYNIKALEYYKKCIKIADQAGNQNSAANALNSIGTIYEKQGNLSEALDYYNQSLQINNQIHPNNKSIEAMVIGNIGQIYYNINEYSKALQYCKQSYDLAKDMGLIRAQRGSCNCLYKVYKAKGNGTKALEYHELLNSIEDSLRSEETIKKLEQMEFARIMQQDSIAKAEEARMIQEAHREEMHQEQQRRKLFMVIGGFVLLLAIGLYSRLRYMRNSKAIIKSERDRSDDLLLNILPEQIAKELKEKGKADAQNFDQVSILFTDFEGFTEHSTKLSAADLVNEINECFEAFDKIVEKYGIEKIKTIGDAYMAAGGLPVPSDTSAKNATLAALEMQNYIIQRKAEHDAKGEAAFEMRVGIHTGPVVAGIVGSKKFQYDVWGDTVNTASRIESSGQTGKVNIGKDTYDLLKDDTDFVFESRGKIEVKGKGEILMWFVSLKDNTVEA